MAPSKSGARRLETKMAVGPSAPSDNADSRGICEAEIHQSHSGQAYSANHCGKYTELRCSTKKEGSWIGQQGTKNQSWHPPP